MGKRENPAVVLGRKGGKATAKKRTPGERADAARRAVKARWDRYYKAHPEKRKGGKKSPR